MDRWQLIALTLVAIAVATSRGNASGLHPISAIQPSTVGAAADTTPPTIHSVEVRTFPSTTGGAANISADVTDDVAVGAVIVDVKGPSQDVNATMVRGPGDTWSTNQSFDASGTYSYTIWAVDSTGNLASAAGSFTLARATTAPPSLAAIALGVVVAAAALAMVWLAFRVRRRVPPKPPPHRI